MENTKEAYRYIDNAKEILSKKAKKDGIFYSDAKYVRMACNTAYSGLLIALNDLFKYKGVTFPNKTKKRRQGVSADFYRENLAKINKKKLKEYNSAYNYLHLLGGYDGDLIVNTSKTGLMLATSIIDWIDKQIK